MLYQREFLYYSTPIVLNYWYSMGFLLSILLANQLITGVLLACYYIPTIASVEWLCFGIYVGICQHLSRVFKIRSLLFRLGLTWYNYVISTHATSPSATRQGLAADISGFLLSLELWNYINIDLLSIIN